MPDPSAGAGSAPGGAGWARAGTRSGRPRRRCRRAWACGCASAAAGCPPRSRSRPGRRPGRRPCPEQAQLARLSPRLPWPLYAGIHLIAGLLMILVELVWLSCSLRGLLSHGPPRKPRPRAAAWILQEERAGRSGRPTCDSWRCGMVMLRTTPCGRFSRCAAWPCWEALAPGCSASSAASSSFSAPPAYSLAGKFVGASGPRICTSEPH